MSFKTKQTNKKIKTSSEDVLYAFSPNLVERLGLNWKQIKIIWVELPLQIHISGKKKWQDILKIGEDQDDWSQERQHLLQYTLCASTVLQNRFRNDSEKSLNASWASQTPPEVMFSNYKFKLYYNTSLSVQENTHKKKVFMFREKNNL